MTNKYIFTFWKPEGSLLSAEKVAEATINTLLSNFTGQVIDVKRES